MKKLYIFIIALFAFNVINAQTYTISFAATGATTTVDSVKVENLTHTATAIWHAGDVLQLQLTNGIKEMGETDENLQVYPNPMQGQAEISFNTKQAGNATLSIYDIAGKEVLQTKNKFLQGTQKLQLTGLKQGMYFISIIGDGYFYTAKLISQNSTTSDAKIKFIDSKMPETALTTLKSTKATIAMPYTTGDNLRFIGYSGSYSTIVNDVPTVSKTITIAFSTLGITTVLIPTDTFIMGSPVTELGHNNYEIQYKVKLTAFQISKYEITNAQYAAFLNAKSIDSNGIYVLGAYPTQALIYVSSGNYDWGLHYTAGQWVPVAGYENHPVINVTWYGATEFATYVGGTLPTEAQWEYACRANKTTPFNTGACLSNAQANYNWASPYNSCTNTNTTLPATTQVVGNYVANSYGLHDMHGNVWEWCSDWYGTYPISELTNPPGAATGSYRVIRGGSWSFSAQYCRSANRSNSTPGNHHQDIGFRVTFMP